MQGKDPFLILLGVGILGVTFFFCGERAVKSPPPVSNIAGPTPSSPTVPPVSAAAVLKEKIDVLLIGNAIAFRLNSAILLPEGKTVLNSVATILQEDPTVAFEVGGHTDNVGPEQSNWVLSEQRAKAVVEYLISRGVAAERLTPKGYGASRPIADGTTDEGRQQNRRIEFSIGAQREQP